MALVQPETFTLTDGEAATLQSIQMAKQAAITRKGPVSRYSSLAAPFIIAGAVYLADLIWFGGDMPFWLFLTLIAVFVAGMFAQTCGYWLNLLAARKRMRQSTRQMYEPRTVRLKEDGIEQSIPTARTLQRWTGVDFVETKKDMILVWAGNLLPVSVPLRAFPSQKDGEAFLAECQRRAAG